MPRASWLSFAATKDSNAKRIDSLEKEIAENNTQIAKLKAKILNILFDNRIWFRNEDLDYFIINAIGDDLMTLMTIGNNMKLIQQLSKKSLRLTLTICSWL